MTFCLPRASSARSGDDRPGFPSGMADGVGRSFQGWRTWRAPGLIGAMAIGAGAWAGRRSERGEKFVKGFVCFGWIRWSSMQDVASYQCFDSRTYSFKMPFYRIIQSTSASEMDSVHWMNMIIPMQLRSTPLRRIDGLEDNMAWGAWDGAELLTAGTDTSVLLSMSRGLCRPWMFLPGSRIV